MKKKELDFDKFNQFPYLEFKGKLPKKVMDNLLLICELSREPHFEFEKIRGGFKLTIDEFDINDNDNQFINFVCEVVELVEEYGEINGKLKVVGSDAGGTFLSGLRVTNNNVRGKFVSQSYNDWY